MKLAEIITSTLKKHQGKTMLLGLAVAFSGIVAISESQKIGSYRPDGLSSAYTSYVAYDKGDAIWLYPPVLKGFGPGPIIDEGKDGTIEYVGTLTYPRIPFSFNQLGSGDPEQRKKRLERNQNLYNNIMEEIWKSAE